MPIASCSQKHTILSMIIFGLTKTSPINLNNLIDPLHLILVIQSYRRIRHLYISSLDHQHYYSSIPRDMMCTEKGSPVGYVFTPTF